MAGKRKVDLPALKREVLKSIAMGNTVEESMRRVSRHPRTYENWRRTDSQFASAVDQIRNRQKGITKDDHPDMPTRVSGTDEDFPSFEEFSEKYLKAKVFPHMLNVIDLMEGRDPRWQPPGIVYEKREPDLAIVNVPPEHGKSTTLTINYITYRLVKDPNTRVIIISKTQAMARKFLYSIKQRLTHPSYAELQNTFGPPEGYDHDAESWSQDMIYLSGDSRDSGEKDPSVQALGIRGHVYGARADIIVLDDGVDLQNAHEYEKQISWIQSEVVSRISASGMFLVVGTRLAPKDLYLELREPSRYPDEESPWTYLSMPAVLEFADNPKDWKTLWPRSNSPEIGAKGEMAQPDEQGLYPKWDGPRLSKKRGRMQPRTWATVYMQQTVHEDAIFHPDAVRAAVNGNRVQGIMPKGMANCRKNGMEGLIVVAGMDPAMAGFTAAVVIGLDPVTQIRHVLGVHNEARMTPDGIRELIKDWTGRYGISEWRIEKNAFQSMLTQDREVREFLNGRGCVLREHQTHSNKWDADFGVASMSMLFTGWEDDRQLIELPSTHGSEGTKALIEQLVTWHPDAPKTQKTDAVMALWFTELACRDKVSYLTGFNRNHQKNSMFHTAWDRGSQRTVNLLDAEIQGAFRPLAG